MFFGGPGRGILGAMGSKLISKYLPKSDSINKNRILGSLEFPRAFSEAILEDFGSILEAGSLGRVTDLIAFGLCLEFLLEIPDGFQSVFEGSRVHTCF